MSEWNKVKEQFPPEHVKVLGLFNRGTDNFDLISVHWSREQGWYTGGISINENLGFDYWTHIRSLPEEYKNAEKR